MSVSRAENERQLLKTIVCPHCWTEFPAEDSLWVSESPDLYGDEKLGDDERKRFSPTEFDEFGSAIDAKGFVCKTLACPRCHLTFPTPMLESNAAFVSIVGGPSSGKSHFLASSTWFLRQTLPRKFNVAFTDADQQSNLRLQKDEETLFLNENANKFARLEKTQVKSGDSFDFVRIDGQTLAYPRPFVFSANPTQAHPNAKKIDKLAVSVCLYDNAGENYLPAADETQRLVTRHLAKSGCVFFLFDPTQDPRFRVDCRKISQDPQLDDSGAFRKTPVRQESILGETIARIREFRHMRTNETYPNPLIVVVTKLDVWRGLIPEIDFRRPPIGKIKLKTREYAALRTDKIMKASAAVRELLANKTPEIVVAAEQFAREVVYIPVSAMGVSPIVEAETNGGVFRPSDLKPIWVVAPMLYALTKLTRGLILEFDGEKPKMNASALK